MSEKKDLTRSDLVRLRREQDSSKRVERAKKVVTRSAPPVTTRARQEKVRSTRRSARSVPGTARTGRGSRRRFQVALLPVAPDAEIRGINISRPQLGPRLLSFLAVAILGAALYFAFNLPQLRVTEAQVIGNQMLTPAEINTSLNIAGKPTFLLIPSALEKSLRLSYPELLSAKVDVALPNTVLVQITERQPVIRWQQGDGYTWVSEDGIAFRPHGEDANLISVVALSAPPTEVNVSTDPLTPAPFISSEMVQALKGLAGHVPQGVPILYEAGSGFGWNDPRGWRVYFGTSARDVELKMRVYESMVTSLTQRGIRPALINVTYPAAPYYRMSE
jgi:POTRA domain-containing FtsQ-type protein